jgi:hypothetical protein
VARWDNRRGQSRCLPRTCWTWLETVRAGGWGRVEAEEVEVPATAIYDGGVWVNVRRGVRGLLVPDERRLAVVYLVCEPATHYYRNMTGCRRMQVLIGERI